MNRLPMSLPFRSFAAAALWACLVIPPLPALAADEFSPAERALFMSNQLASLRPPLTLN